MSQETASILGNSYRIYSLKYIPYTHSTCRHLVLQGIGKVPRTHNHRKYDDTSPAFLESGPRSPALDATRPNLVNHHPTRHQKAEAGASRFLIPRLRGFPYHFRSWILEPLRNPTALARKPCACPGVGLVEPPAFLNLRT